MATLTAKRIENAKPQQKPYKISDGRGLYVLVTPGASKLFHLRYTFEGRERLMAMGAIGLADARRRAEDARAEIAAGRDPLAAKIAVKVQRKIAADNSFESVVRGWHKDWSERLRFLRVTPQTRCAGWRTTCSSHRREAHLGN